MLESHNYKHTLKFRNTEISVHNKKWYPTETENMSHTPGNRIQNSALKRLHAWLWTWGE